MPTPTPYHPGELAAQAAAGRESAAEASGRSIADRIVVGAWPFLEAQRIAVLGSWDGNRNAWPTFAAGPPGFMSTRDGRQLCIDTTTAALDPADPLWPNLKANGLLSLLAIDLSSRRRLRVNGRVEQPAPAAHRRDILEMTVDQAYPNCPRYVQRRHVHVPAAVEPGCLLCQSRALSDGQIAVIERADTLFVATAHRDQGTDVSHRGGRPGFVRVVAPGLLRIPDYAGNGMFNTLGNIHASGIAGILFLDFEANRQLQLVGDAAVDWQPGLHGAERNWTLSVREVRESTLPRGLSWQFVDASPFNP